MIAYLQGEIFAVEENRVVLLCNSIGYEVFITGNTADYPIGSSATFYTFLNVREDAMELYGFPSRREKEVFMHLRTVTGIGPKSALGILGAGPLADLVRAIIHENTHYLVTLPGVGKKTASRLILELKERLESYMPEDEMAPLEKPESPPDGVVAEVLGALQALGYSTPELRAVEKDILSATDQDDVQRLLKDALAYLKKG